MYLPPHFGSSDAAVGLELADAHPFATLLAFEAGGAPFVTHLPMLLVPPKAGGPARFLGHVARRNEQWKVFRDNPQALALFHGPHTYVTPTWYRDHDVPTWNYAVVHVKGTIRLLETPRELAHVLALLTDRFEADTKPEPWRFELPDDLRGEGALAAAIVGYELTVTEVTAKIKLNQNRSAADRSGVLSGLATRTDDASKGVLELMRRFSAADLPK